MSDDIFALLHMHKYFQGVSDVALRQLLQHAHLSQHPDGAIVHEANTLLTSIGFVLRGRLKAVKVDDHGTETLFRMIERGEQFGMMVGSLSDPVPVRVIALESTTVLNLDYEDAMTLTTQYPQLRRLWLTTFAENFRMHFLGFGKRQKPSLLGIVHLGPDTRGIAGRLVRRLCELNETLVVFSDSDRWQEQRGIRWCSVYGTRRDGEPGSSHNKRRLLDFDEIRRRAAEWRDADRIIFDVSMDLVGGNAVVRSRGDATDAILESIILPVLSVPICRDGQALVDGGLVNNIPADVLVGMGCNFVIAVSVTANIEKEFCSLTLKGPHATEVTPNFVQTLLRSLLVQNYNMTAIGVRSADLLIAPDVSGFDLADFSRVQELASIGAAATHQQLPRIQKLLARLDPQLFAKASRGDEHGDVSQA